MEKKDENVWSTDDIRAHCMDWNLAADAALMEHIESLSQNLLSRTHCMLQSVENLGMDLNVATTGISNTRNKFLFLANTQFVENRVYDDEDSPLVDSTTSKQAKPGEGMEDMSSVLEDALKNGIAVVDSKFNVFQLPESDSDDDDSSPSHLLRPHNPYADRLLPHLIGSAEFFKDDKIGLNSALGSSESSSSLSICDDELPDNKSSLNVPSLSMEDNDSMNSVTESRAESPMDNLFGSFKNNIHPSSKPEVWDQAENSRYSGHSFEQPSSQSRFPEVQKSESSSNGQSSESVKPSYEDSFNSKLFYPPMNPNHNLFSPPPFNGEESSEESDNESLFGYQKSNHRRLILDDDEPNLGMNDERQKSISIDKENSRLGLFESDKMASSTSKEQPKEKKLPAGAVNIFGKNINPFMSSTVPPLFPESASDNDSSDQIQDDVSDDARPSNRKSSWSVEKSTKNDNEVSKPSPRNSLFDDEEDTKDLDSLLFKPDLFSRTNKSTPSSNNSKKTASDLFSGSSEDIFSSASKTEEPNEKFADLFSGSKAKETRDILTSENSNTVNTNIFDDLFANPANSPRSVKSNSATPNLFKKSDLKAKPSTKTLTKPKKETLFDSSSDDELFPTSANKILAKPKKGLFDEVTVEKNNVGNKREDISSNTDTVDFTRTINSSTGSKGLNDVASTKAKLSSSLFDNDDDDDEEDFLFSGAFSKKKNSIFSTLDNSPTAVDKMSAVNNSEKIDSFDSNESYDSFREKLDVKDETSIGKGNIPNHFSSSKIFEDTTSSKNAVSDIKTGIVNQREFMSSGNNISSSTSDKSELFDPKVSPQESSDLFSSDKSPSKTGTVFSINAEKRDLENLFDSPVKNSSSGATFSSSANPSVKDSVRTSVSKSEQTVSSSTEDAPLFISGTQKDILVSSKPNLNSEPNTENSYHAGIEQTKETNVSPSHDNLFGSEKSDPSQRKAAIPGKLASERGQNINVAALMPGYKHSIKKNESSVSNQFSSRSSESDEVSNKDLSNKSDAVSADSVSNLDSIIDSKVGTSISQSSSIFSSSSSNVDWNGLESLSESSTFSHILTNDAMKKRAKINVKRRPPSQKARKESAQASLISNDSGEKEPLTVTPDSSATLQDAINKDFLIPNSSENSSENLVENADSWKESSVIKDVPILSISTSVITNESSTEVLNSVKDSDKNKKVNIFESSSPEGSAHDLFGAGSKEHVNKPSIDHSKEENESAKIPFDTSGSHAPLLADKLVSSDLSDDDLFGSYRPKPVNPVIEKFKSDKNSAKIPSASVVVEESKENDEFSDSDDIEKLFPKVKLGKKKSSSPHPLSEVTGDTGEEDPSVYFDPPPSSNQNTANAEDIFSNSRKDDIFSKARGDDIFSKKGDDIFSKVGDDIFSTARGNTFSNAEGSILSSNTPSSAKFSGEADDDTLFDKPVQKERSSPILPDKSRGNVKDNKLSNDIFKSSLFEDDEAASTDSFSGSSREPPALFANESQSFRKSISSTDDKPSSKKLIPFEGEKLPFSEEEPSKLTTKKNLKTSGLFDDDDEEDDLFGLSRESQPKKSSLLINKQPTFKTDPKKPSSPISSDIFSPSKKEIKSKKSSVFESDNDEDDDIFSSQSSKSVTNKTVAPEKKKASPLPKLNTSIIFGDSDSDDELFLSSLRKKK